MLAGGYKASFCTKTDRLQVNPPPGTSTSSAMENDGEFQKVDQTLSTLSAQVQQCRALVEVANDEAAKLREENGALEDRIFTSDQRVSIPAGAFSAQQDACRANNVISAGP